MPEQVKTKLNELMAGLKNESSTARLETIETIGTLRNREAMDAFKNPDAPKGLFANFVPTLFSLMLSDNCSVVRDKALHVLNRIGVRDSGPSITKALLSDREDSAKHLMAANIFDILLGLEQDMPVVLKEVLPLLQHEEWYHDLVAARAWTASQIRQVADFSNIPHNAVAQAIAPLAATEFLILESQVPKVIETLLSLLRSHSWYVRLVAARALTETSVFLESQIPLVIQILLPLLNDNNPEHLFAKRMAFRFLQYGGLCQYSYLHTHIATIVQLLLPMFNDPFFYNSHNDYDLKRLLEDRDVPIPETELITIVQTLISMLNDTVPNFHVVINILQSLPIPEGQVPLVIQALLPILNADNETGGRAHLYHIALDFLMTLRVMEAQVPFVVQGILRGGVKRKLEDYQVKLALEKLPVSETQLPILVQLLLSNIDDVDNMAIDFLMEHAIADELVPIVIEQILLPKLDSLDRYVCEATIKAFGLIKIPEAQLPIVIQALSLKLHDYWLSNSAKNTLAAIEATKMHTPLIVDNQSFCSNDDAKISPPIFLSEYDTTSFESPTPSREAHRNSTRIQNPALIEAHGAAKATLKRLAYTLQQAPKPQLSIELAGVFEHHVRRDARTGAPIYRMNFFPPELPVLTDGKNTSPTPRDPIGSLDLYGEPIPCRSVDGSRTNMLNPRGVIASQLPDPNAIEGICEALPPTLLESAQIGVEMGVAQGLLSGVTNVMGRAVCSKSSSEKVIQAVQLLLYNSFYFTLRCQAHLAEGQPLEATLYDAAVETSQMFVASTAGKIVSSIGREADKRFGFSKLGTSLTNLGKGGPLLYSAYQRGVVDTGAYILGAYAAQDFVEGVGNCVVNSLRK